MLLFKCVEFLQRNLSVHGWQTMTAAASASLSPISAPAFPLHPCMSAHAAMISWRCNLPRNLHCSTYLRICFPVLSSRRLITRKADVCKAVCIFHGGKCCWAKLFVGTVFLKFSGQTFLTFYCRKVSQFCGETVGNRGMFYLFSATLRRQSW